ncbi:unnamed protein product [Adineta steineri]|uniref:Uncharacterized protein n=3 Tax=Adineta steineri TaxID=433720 RepID=A0A813U8P0_9BILA|nr:unnamed protein product [Adineta steineri]
MVNSSSSSSSSSSSINDLDNIPKTNSKCPPKPNKEAPRIRYKTYYNKTFTVANRFEMYQVHTIHLHGVHHFFSDSNDHDKSDTSSLDKSTLLRRICMACCVRYRRQRIAVERRHELADNLIIQTYNKKPEFIRKLFSKTIEGDALRTTVRAVHRDLYSPGFFRRKRRACYMRTGQEFIRLMAKDGGAIPNDEKCRKHQESEDEEIRKRKQRAFHSSPEFTYTLLPDGVFHIARADTGLRNIASKHALQASCEPEVIYAGTCRFEKRDDEEDIVFVVDNDSGTYAPKNKKDELARLKSLLEWNFRGLKVDAKIYVPPGMDDNEDDDDDGKENA